MEKIRTNKQNAKGVSTTSEDYRVPGGELKGKGRHGMWPSGDA